MIRSSFIFIRGIGDKTEKVLWAAGVFTWDDLSATKNRLPNDLKTSVSV
jgi:predicted flap endonuclease-1-like 5' DNA nuclease